MQKTTKQILSIIGLSLILSFWSFANFSSDLPLSFDSKTELIELQTNADSNKSEIYIFSLSEDASSSSSSGDSFFSANGENYFYVEKLRTQKFLFENIKSGTNKFLFYDFYLPRLQYQ